MAQNTSITEVVQMLNSGKLTMEQLMAELKTDSQYLRTGNGYQRLTMETVSQINGKLANVYVVNGEKIDRSGKPVVRKPRSPKAK